MRLAYVCADPGVPILGSKGCSIHVQEMVAAMGELGVQLELISPRMEQEKPASWRHVTLHPVRPVPKGALVEREKACIELNHEVVGVLRRLGGLDGVYERYSLWSMGPCRWARSQQIPFLLEVNAPLIQEQIAHRALHDVAAAQAIEAELFATSTRVLPVTEAVGQYVQQVAPEATIKLIGNGANPARFKPVASIDARPLTIGFVGTMKPWHGVDVLLDAFKTMHEQYPNARLLLVGNGTEFERLQKRAVELGIGSHTVFTGAVSPAAVPEFVSKMDIAVAPYPANESFYFCPLKVLEYMSSACAVVASDIGVLHEWIEDRRSGRLVRPGDAAVLADALIELASDSELRRQLGKAARETVLREHTWQQVAQRVLRELHSFEPHAGCAWEP